MKIKKTSALIIYWIIALTSVAAILISLDYSFGKALFLSTLIFLQQWLQNFFLHRLYGTDLLPLYVMAYSFFAQLQCLNSC